MSRFSSLFLVSLILAGAVRADDHEGEAVKADTTAVAGDAANSEKPAGYVAKDLVITHFGEQAKALAAKQCARNKDAKVYDVPACELSRIIDKSCSKGNVMAVGITAAWILDPYTFDFLGSSKVERIEAGDDADTIAEKKEEAASALTKSWGMLTEELSGLRADSEQLLAHRKGDFGKAKGEEARGLRRSLDSYIDFSRAVRKAAGETRLRGEPTKVLEQKYFQTWPQITVPELGGPGSKTSLEISLATADKRHRAKSSDTVELDRGEGYVSNPRTMKVDAIRLHFGDHAADICRAE